MKLFTYNKMLTLHSGEIFYNYIPLLNSNKFALWV